MIRLRKNEKKLYAMKSKSWDITRQTLYMSRTSVGNKIVAHSDAVGTSPVGAAPTSSSFST